MWVWLPAQGANKRFHAMAMHFEGGRDKGDFGRYKTLNVKTFVTKIFLFYSTNSELYISFFRPLHLFRMSIFRAAHGWGEGQKDPPSWNLSQISYNNETWHSYTLPKEDSKNIWMTWHMLVMLASSFFYQKSANFLYQEIQIKIAFWYKVSNSFWLSLSC